MAAKAGRRPLIRKAIIRDALRDRVREHERHLLVLAVAIPNAGHCTGSGEAVNTGLRWY